MTAIWRQRRATKSPTKQPNSLSNIILQATSLLLQLS